MDDVTHLPGLNVAAAERVAREVLRVLAESDCDPLAKPFAALSAAGTVAALAAEQDEYMRARITRALLDILRVISPEAVVELPRTATKAH